MSRSDDSSDLTACALAEALRSRRISAVEALEACLDRIESRNPALNAVVILDADAAMARARQADAALARSELWGPLHGVPFTMKDAFAAAGLRSTVGFAPMDHVSARDATITARLKAAGGILVGKTNVATLLGDYQSTNEIFGRTNNPWNLARTAGGSSGGSAAALAAGMTPFEIGTDLGGSIRIPSHFCGVYGLKPTENRVSSTGVFPFPTAMPRSVRVMNTIGPMARSVEDLALLYGLIAGPDGEDTEVQPVPVETAAPIEIKTLRIGFAPTLPGVAAAAEIQAAVERIAGRIAGEGAIVEAASLDGLAAAQHWADAEGLIGMMLDAFEPKPDKPPATLADYLAALNRRDEAILAWETALASWDALLCPIAMVTAFPHCATGAPITVDGETVNYWALATHSTVFNYTGHPAVAIPCGLDRDGLPIGLQLVGKRWSEARLLAVAQAVAPIAGGFVRPPGY